MPETRSPGGVTTMDLYRAVVEPVGSAPTRDELGGTICERLSSLAPVAFAFVGWTGSRGGAVSADSWAGTDADALATLLERIEHADGPVADGSVVDGAEPSAEDGDGPAVLDDGDPPVRDLTPLLPEFDVAEGGMLVPLVSRGEVAGWLGLGVEGRELLLPVPVRALRNAGAVVGRVAATLGTAVDGEGQVLSLELASAAIADPFRAVADEGVTVLVDQFVEGDDQWIAFVGVTDISPVEFRAAVTSFPFVTAVRHLGADGDEDRFEVRLESSSMESTLSRYGGHLGGIVIDEEAATIEATLPANAPLPTVLADLREACPDLQLVSKQANERRQRTIPETRDELLAALTDRQRSVLRAAHRAGYFEWPRASTGEEVSDALGVSPPTFHQHVREGQHTLFDRLFETDDPEFISD